MTVIMIMMNMMMMMANMMVNSKVTVLHPPTVSLDQSYQHGPRGATLELVCTVKVKTMIMIRMMMMIMIMTKEIC